MNQNALYFPYINIPQSKWLTETLLYWEKLSSIVPYEVTQNSSLLDTHMEDLHSVGLVDFLQPGAYLSKLNNFDEKFFSIAKIWKSLNVKKDYPLSRIHMEKLNDLGPLLVELKLAQWDNYPWLLMPTPLANIFMSYLATELAKIPDLNVTPLTDISSDLKYLNDSERTDIRKNILSEILPVPRHGIDDLDKLLRFKQEYGHLTRNFRNRIEEECDIILAGSPIDLEEKILQTKKNLKEEKDQIEDSMRSISDDIVFTSIVPLLGTLSSGINSPQGIVSAGLAIASTAYQIVSNLSVNVENRKKPLAYATLAGNYFNL